jgi:hypothetical protein
MLDRAGLFATDFPRGQDLELILRVWRAGGRGMYEPTMVVTHKIPRSRTNKAHHRAWHSREGIIRARVRYKELFDRDGRMVAVPRRAILGVPLFLIDQLVRSMASWAGAIVRRNEADAFYHECQTRQHFNYLRERVRSRGRGAAPVAGALAYPVTSPPHR